MGSRGFGGTCHNPGRVNGRSVFLLTLTAPTLSNYRNVVRATQGGLMTGPSKGPPPCGRGLKACIRKPRFLLLLVFFLYPPGCGGSYPNNGRSLDQFRVGACQSRVQHVRVTTPVEPRASSDGPSRRKVFITSRATYRMICPSETATVLATTRTSEGIQVRSQLNMVPTSHVRPLGRGKPTPDLRCTALRRQRESSCVVRTATTTSRQTGRTTSPSFGWRGPRREHR